MKTQNVVRRWGRWASLWCASAVAAGTPVLQSASGSPGPVNESLLREARAALDRSAEWLLARQHEEGHWSNPQFPALTALPVWALCRAGLQDSEAVRRGVAYLVSCAHENGAIYREPEEDRQGGGLSNYNTALAMVALHEAGDPDLVPLVLAARRFLAGHQHLGGDLYHGGMGYDAETRRAYADLSNSHLAYEAMRLTEAVEDLRPAGEEKADLDWEAARRFLARVQNLPGVNPAPWVTDDPDDQGGFAYHPMETKADTEVGEEGRILFRSYGSMTYAGLLSLIYAEVERDDPRVRSAFDWAARHWTLEENPGVGEQGLYFFFNVLTKALQVYGRDQLPGPDGGRNWRAEVTRRLVNLQRVDPDTGHGYWVNDVGRWWESDPVLVTSYSMLALLIAAGL